MMIFKKTIARRTFLRGAGASIALPLLDGMIPAFAGPLDSAARPAVRMSIIFVPNGRILDKWTPKTEGRNFELPPILQPLDPYKDDLLVLSGLASAPANAPAGRVGPHPTASAMFLTGVAPNPPGQAGVSVDQIAAKELGKRTQLASLELSLESGETGGGSDGADSDAYLNTISWRTASTPLPVENNPRNVFERLFGDNDSTDAAERMARIKKQRSILDFVSEGTSRLMARVGPGDRGKLNEYLDAIRDLESRIQRIEGASTQQLPVVERPTGTLANYEEYSKLMFDLQVLAYQCDLTRVTTFSMGREKSERAYREIGLEEGHHALTHHGGDAGMIAKVVQIETYQSKMFSYFIGKLKSVADGEGSLLDHSIILFASDMGDGNIHLQQDLPIVLLGGGAGKIKGGRHVRYPKDTPLMNLLLTLLDTAGVPVERLGNSTGKIDLLSIA